ncbi:MULTISPECIES: hypothetical protein [Pseudoalteromonas]|uniref:Membrane protein triplicated sequence n=1 Tax=Pseudoalteromonas amylolytica TaxID=1859457 RepID=A0A1S1MMH9_9GAMM|nr:MULTISPECIES: hypothetical protein [Pseudoalteromonas]OHU86292.1 hypothetical protein BFC16_16450 [Pseudoalteromonas sp. JW3]OHU89603.1 hypothetical protein BET10_15870 [Pseudoalteromonas amylolytica]
MFGELSLHFDTIILLGLILAFVFNLSFRYLNIVKSDSLVVTAGIIATSYFISNHFFKEILASTYPYLVFFISDLLTVCAIVLLHKLLSLKPSRAYWYVIFGLSMNGLLFIAMHTDRFILENSEPWWFWTVYSVSINFFDLMMVAVLILNRDLLLLGSLWNKVKALTKVSGVLNTK